MVDKSKFHSTRASTEATQRLVEFLIAKPKSGRRAELIGQVAAGFGNDGVSAL